MSTNLSLPSEVNPVPFKKYFLEYLGVNLSSTLCSSLANLLAIDYTGRLNSSISLDTYINECSLRIKKNLGLKVITDESFSSVMTLFTIAITPEKDIDTDDDKSKDKSQDALIDTIITTYFNDLAPEEVAIIKTLIKDLLNGKDGKEMMNVASSNPKLFYSIIVTAVREKNKSEEVLESVRNNLSNALVISKHKDQKQSTLKNIVNKLSLIGGLIATASSGLILGGLALPALIFPATATVVKLSPRLVDTIIPTAEKINNTMQQKLSTKSPSPHVEDNKLSPSTIKNIETKIDKAKLGSLVKALSIKSKTKGKVSKPHKTRALEEATRSR